MANTINQEIMNAEVLNEDQEKDSGIVAENPAVTDEEATAEETLTSEVTEEEQTKKKRLNFKEIIALVCISTVLILLLIWLVAWLTGIPHRISLDSRLDKDVSYTESTDNTQGTDPTDKSDSTDSPVTSDNSNENTGGPRNPNTTQNTNPDVGNTNNGNWIGGNGNGGDNGNHGDTTGNDGNSTTNPGNHPDNGNNGSSGNNGNTDNNNSKPTDNGNGQGSGNGGNTDNKNDNDSTPDYTGDAKVKIAAFNDDTGIITVTVDGESLMVPVQTTYFNGRVTKSGVAQGKIFGYNVGTTVMLFYPQTSGFNITETNGYMSRTNDGLTVLVDLNGEGTKLLIKINGMKSLF